MIHANGNTIGLLIAGLLVSVLVVSRLYSGVSFTLRPPARVTRKEDPFSFWMTVGPATAFAVFLLCWGIAGLFVGR